VTGNGRTAMIRSVEGSLRRLGTDRIDVLWAHAPDGLTPMDEIVHAFDHLVASGKVGHVGLSNFPAWQSAQAVGLADRFGWARLVGIQVEYSLVERAADREQVPMAVALGLGVTAWSPLGGGTLTGKYRQGETGRLQTWGRVVRQEDTQRRVAVVDAVIEAAGELGVPPAAVAMSWLRSRQTSIGTALVPIAGPRTPEQLDVYLAALELDLPAHVAAGLDDVSAPDLGAPHEGNLRQRKALHAGQHVIDAAAPVRRAPLTTGRTA
jgi:aryl-alcohol dehydrogenase-like predicted oxidoreductase